MLFQYSQFFIVVLFIYYLIPLRYRWLWLLLASYFFYVKINPSYTFLLLIISIIAYFSGLIIKRNNSEKLQKKILIMDLIICFGILFFFKYLNFFIGSFGVLFKNLNLPLDIPSIDLILPLGISFYIFKSTSYVIDIYRGEELETDFKKILLYIAFFPQLLAGPIERAKRFFPQVSEIFHFEHKVFKNGIRLILWGYFQKLVIAENLATLVDPIYNNPFQYEGISLLLATVFYSFQIYCDFSGYSDIAIGSAQLMGLSTMTNFNRPYFASSIQEFWRRWHISLSTWLRDYIYIPLGGSRVYFLRHYLNILITMLICGLWHGANLTFVIWGAIHGIYLIFYVLTRELRNNFYKFIGLENSLIQKSLRSGITFFLVSFAWIFFRANNISEAFYIIYNIFIGLEGLFSFKALGGLIFFKDLRFEAIISIFSIGVLLFIEKKGTFIDWLSNKPLFFRWIFYYFLILMILLCGNFGQKQFIYFQF